MKIKFAFEVGSFADAALLEEIFKANGVKYTVSINGNNTVRKRKKSTTATTLRRARITKEELAAVVLCIKSNPEWDNPKVAKQTNVSAATVHRIREGSHTLQQKRK